MFEEYTQDYFLSIAQQYAAEKGLDATEGTLIFNASSMMAVMLEDALDREEEAIANLMPDTADREHLIRFGRKLGIEPRAATACTVKIHTDADFPAGTRLSGSEFTYKVLKKLSTEADGSFYFEAQCETPGTAANGALDPLTAEDSEANETFCDITEILTPGTDDEDTEEFRERYFVNTEIPPMSGNRNYYIEAAKEIPGVETARVFSETDADTGRSEISLWIVGDGYTAPGEELRAAAQETIDPTDGKGDGKASCDHHVTVYAAGETAVDLRLSVTVKKTADKNVIEADIKAAVQSCFEKLNRTWDAEDELTVRALSFEAAALLLDGVTDVSCTLGESTTDRAIKLGNNLGKAGNVNVIFTDA